MIDRTELDLRLAAHATTTERINRREWQRQGTGSPRPVRAALAAVLVALAARLVPASPPPAPLGLPERHRPATI